MVKYKYMVILDYISLRVKKKKVENSIIFKVMNINIFIKSRIKKTN